MKYNYFIVQKITAWPKFFLLAMLDFWAEFGLQCKNYIKLKTIITAPASVLVGVSFSVGNDVHN